MFTYAKLARVFADHRVPPDRFLPLWFTEGLAEYWSGQRDYQHEMILRDGLTSGSFVPLENLDRIAGTYQMYKEGEAICHFISETYGEEKVLDLIDNAWRDVDFRRVMAYTLGERFETISERFTAWTKGEVYPRLQSAELATLVAEGVGVEGFSAKPVAWTRADGQREVVFVGNRSGYSNLYVVDVDSAYAPRRAARVLVKGERSDRFEAFHLFESAMSVTRDGRLAFVTKSGETDVIHVYDLARRRMLATYRLPDLGRSLLARVVARRPEDRRHRHRTRRLRGPVRPDAGRRCGGWRGARLGHRRARCRARPTHPRRLRRPRPGVDALRRCRRLLVGPWRRRGARALHAPRLRPRRRAPRARSPRAGSWTSPPRSRPTAAPSPSSAPHRTAPGATPRRTSGRWIWMRAWRWTTDDGRRTTGLAAVVLRRWLNLSGLPDRTG